MFFLVHTTHPTRGSWLLGYLEANNAQGAQDSLVNVLIRLGTREDTITRQVTDYTTLRVRDCTLTIGPIRSCGRGPETAALLIALSS